MKKIVLMILALAAAFAADGEVANGFLDNMW